MVEWIDIDNGDTSSLPIFGEEIIFEDAAGTVPAILEFIKY